MSNEIKGMMDIVLIGSDCWNKSNIPLGVVKLPDEISVDGEVIVVGENDTYLHCFISNTGAYFGIYKSDDPKHIYQLILKLNLQE